ncbi:MAG: MotA/TolQ/ExbB proton channel family protein [Ignavibacteriales bacterium]|nr:MotA/TolQ/ExbB proton channel family protein [Ignavibacteriales bacterium]
MELWAAVLGLIDVMRKNLQDPSLLGHGIATAFVATVYGVEFGNNLLFLPVAGSTENAS